jgi:drug/metabolite transporter (DMT)-like permease
MTVLMGAMMVLVRNRPAQPMLAAACLSAFASAALVFPLAAPLSPAGTAFAWLLLFGGQFGVGLLLLTLGTRLVPATRAALIGSLELPLAPLAVWIAFAEVPSWPSALGGTVILAAVLADTLRLGGGAGAAIPPSTPAPAR